MEEKEQRIKEIEARANAACIGPWIYKASEEYLEHSVDAPAAEYEVEKESQRGKNCNVCFKYLQTCGDFVWSQEIANMQFIAHAREDIPFLLSEVSAFRAAQKEAAGHMQDIKAWMDEEPSPFNGHTIVSCDRKRFYFEEDTLIYNRLMRVLGLLPPPQKEGEG